MKEKLNLPYFVNFLKNTRKGDQEISFYKNFFKKEYEIIINDLKRKTFKIIDQSKLVVNTGSTLGFETLARKIKVALCHPYALSDNLRGKNDLDISLKKIIKVFFGLLVHQRKYFSII